MTKLYPIAVGSTDDASGLIDQRIAGLADWRADTLSKVRAIVLAAEPEIVEEWKWNTPTWSRGGILCTGEVYKKVVKLTFPKGAQLPDPAGLFNSSLEGNARRAIDIAEGEVINKTALRDLIRAAVALNVAGSSKPTGRRGPRKSGK